MIEAKNIAKRYGGKTVFRDLDLTVPDGKCTVLTGASGIGKTTLLRVLAGLEPPDGGSVSGLEGRRATFIFQENRLLPHASALENILCVAPDAEKALYYLRRTGLADEKDKAANKLSGGMRRRLSIARALAYGGDIYFMDEPLRELDEGTQTMIEALLLDEIKGKTALLITHDVDFARKAGDVILTFAGSPMTLTGTETDNR